jgi:membrane protease YdiL (CAAX protease family)
VSLRAERAAPATQAAGLALAAAGAACMALALRSPGFGGPMVAAVVGFVGLAIPVPAAVGAIGSPPLARSVVLVLGASAFVLVAMRGDLVGTPASVVAVGASSLAAVAEEALFRRALYGWLARASHLAAIVLTALAFAVVHLPGYGPGSFWVNLGAGLVLGWQRWASASWTVPAATHVLANLLQLRW